MGLVRLTIIVLLPLPISELRSRLIRSVRDDLLDVYDAAVALSLTAHHRSHHPLREIVRLGDLIR
jgi:hypothetical protein